MKLIVLQDFHNTGKGVVWLEPAEYDLTGLSSSTIIQLKHLYMFRVIFNILSNNC